MTEGRRFLDERADTGTEGVFPGHSFEESPPDGKAPEKLYNPSRPELPGCSETTEVESAGGETSQVTNMEGLGSDGASVPIGPGQILFDQYRVIQLIGRGGMGEVWLVEHLDFECPRALKLIDPSLAADPLIRKRFRLEAQAGARLNHPNAVTVHHMKLTHDAAFIEMEYVAGQSLNRRLRPGEPMPLDWTARILVQLCDVLQVAHDHMIVHRDLKPSNLMLLDGRPPDREHLKVLDFGIAKILEPAGTIPDEEQLTKPGSFLGTILYTSPEQATLGPVDARTDLYTVGVILYELLTGHRPFFRSGGDARARLSSLPPRSGRPIRPPMFPRRSKRLSSAASPSGPRTAPSRPANSPGSFSTPWPRARDNRATIRDATRSRTLPRPGGPSTRRRPTPPVQANI